MTRILGGEDGLPDEWDKTAEMLTRTAETMLGVIYGKRKGDRETNINFALSAIFEFKQQSFFLQFYSARAAAV